MKILSESVHRDFCEPDSETLTSWLGGFNSKQSGAWGRSHPNIFFYSDFDENNFPYVSDDLRKKIPEKKIC